MDEVGDIDGEKGYFCIDVFGKIKVAVIVLINSSVVAALANEGYATTIFETERDFEEDDAGLHLVSFTALGTEGRHILMVLVLVFCAVKVLV